MLYAYQNGNAQSVLNEKDNENLNVLSESQARALNGHAVAPGIIQFTYGAGIPTIVCAILEITDVCFEEGEKLMSVQLGDAARWNIDTAVSGSGTSQTEHLIIKPMDSGLKTSLMVATSKRTYHLKLKSSTKDYMPAVTFYYPKSRLTLADQSEMADDLGYAEQLHSPQVNYKNQPAQDTDAQRKNYSYFINGTSDIRPVNAFDDGLRTYIQMDPEVTLRELPSILEISIKEGVMFDDERMDPVNFRYEGNTFIVDGVYKHLRLCFHNGDAGIHADVIRG